MRQDAWAPPLVELAGGMPGHLLAWERHQRDGSWRARCPGFIGVSRGAGSQYFVTPVDLRCMSQLALSCRIRIRYHRKPRASSKRTREDYHGSMHGQYKDHRLLRPDGGSYGPYPLLDRSQSSAQGGADDGNGNRLHRSDGAGPVKSGRLWL